MQNRTEANDIEANDIEANDIEANDIEANDIEANDIEANDIEANDIEANGIEANDIVAQTEDIVRERMAGQAAGHGVDHVLRVLKSAREIQAEVGGDLRIVELAALLHDVGDAKLNDGVERSGEFTREILSSLGADPDTIEHVAHIVDNLSFRKRMDAEQLSIEGKIVQDADRLDALGAIGIVRTIEYGASRGQPFYSADASDTPTGLQHFDDKLFQLKGLMNTESAKRIAEQRESFMRQFVAQFWSECPLMGQTCKD